MLGVRTRIRNRIRQAIREIVAETPYIAGDDGSPGFVSQSRVHLGARVALNNATLNVNGGSITIGDDSFLGSDVSLLTGTHDPSLRGRDRSSNVSRHGRDIVIDAGVWIASNATVIGPCHIGADAVIAAGSVVVNDVRAGEIVGGVPARHMSWVQFQS